MGKTKRETIVLSRLIVSIGSKGAGTDSIYGPPMCLKGCTHGQPSLTKRLTEEKVIWHRTKDASLKCGFIPCIRSRYRFSCPSCISTCPGKHAFFGFLPYTYLTIIRPST
jgi:Fe-S-cluster-containing dehydrogenase component